MSTSTKFSKKRKGKVLFPSTESESAKKMREARDNLRKTATDLDDLSNSAEGTESQELLSPVSATGRTVRHNNITTPPTGTKSPRGLVVTETVPETEETWTNDASTSARKDQLVAELKEDVEVALTLTMSLKKKLDDIHKAIATKQEVKELARAFETKVEDVLKVASRNVSVEKVSEYRIVKR